MSATLSQLPTPDFASDRPHPIHETVIEPRTGWIAVDWVELLRQRELLMFLIWRDIKVRYKQATLGVAWAVLQPLSQVVIFSLLFGMGLNLGSKFGADPSKQPPPYALFVFAALLPWQFFARSMQDGGLSLVSQQHLLTKIYFPRLFVPTASVGGALFDMLISLPIFIATMAFYHMAPPWTVVFLPFLIVGTFVLASGMAYLLSALTVKYRDFRFIIQFAVQIWMWLSFVMIPFPANWAKNWKGQLLLHANPMYGYIATYRKILVPNADVLSPWSWSMLASSILFSVGFFVLGIFYFRRTERKFADIA